ncbi:MAG TPA: hypothetical protein VMK66_18525, partial [Myxococcales bacterium]|nr:hypothetical protein [Myxococcales bacterium]
MAREVTFPRSRHVALSALEQPGEAKAEGSEAIVVPIRDAARPTPPPGIPLPPPAEEGGPGVPEKGALPAAAKVEGLEAGTQQPAPQIRELAWVVAADVGEPSGEADRCRALDGSPAAVRCPSSLEGRDAAGALASGAALAGEAVLLEGLDRWYRLGPEGAGYCRSCELALVEHLREGYGDQFEPFDALEALRSSALPARERPFARQKEAVRLAEAVEAGKRAILRARDDARRKRSVEIAVLGRVGALTPAALELCAHLDGLLFDLPSLDPFAALLPLLAARAALGIRPAVAVLPAEATPAQVRLFAGLASACDADVMVAAGASAEARGALAAHRGFLSLVRERYRPASPLFDAEVLFSPRCDHWTGGGHQRSAAAAVAALARSQVQPNLRLDLSGGVRARLLVLAGASAISAPDAAAARRYAEAGGDILLLGKCLPLDEEARTGDPVFPEAKSGLERVGEGRVFALDDGAQEAAVARALRELTGRGRAQVLLSGRGHLLSRAYLDPERKLDVHFVNLELRGDRFAPAPGVQLTTAGQAAGGGRAGDWFAPERSGG